MTDVLVSSLAPATRRMLAAAWRASSALVVAALLGSCGSDVDVCTNPGGQGCTRDFSIDLFVETPGRFGALQVNVAHIGDEGYFIGAGDDVDCVALVDAIVASNSQGHGLLKVGLISLAGIQGPAAVLRCGFRSTGNPAPSDFDVEVTDASDTDSNEIDPPPTVVVSTITRR